MITVKDTNLAFLANSREYLSFYDVKDIIDTYRSAGIVYVLIALKDHRCKTNLFVEGKVILDRISSNISCSLRVNKFVIGYNILHFIEM